MNNTNNSFQSIVQTTEHIKEVLSEARLLYLTGLNAMFISSRANQHANGYATVTRELRSFSATLNQEMVELKKGIFELLLHVAHFTKRSRQAQLLERAFDLVPANRRAEYGGALVEHLGAKRADTHKEIAVMRCHLTGHMQDILRYCIFGEQLAVHAKVEAMAVGIGNHDDLQQVADQITDNVNRIREILNQSIRCIAAAD